MIKAIKGKMQKSRILEGLSQAELARQIGLNASSICLIENGRIGTTPKTAKAICELLGKTFDELFLIQ